MDARGASRSRRAMFAASVMIVATVAMAANGSFTLAAARRTHTIAMDGTRFVPETHTVRQGDRVVWVNKDPFPHTATAAGKFDSKPMAAGDAWSFAATEAGEFAYVCTLHPGMQGVLIVK